MSEDDEIESRGQVSPSEVAPFRVREQLSNILKSCLFADSQRMVRFLRFAVEETLAGNASQLKENVIGVQVFDRKSGYDPRLDPIVRVEARRLRTKLRMYYETAGEQDQIVFELPKGRYSPVFSTRSATQKSRDIGEKTIAILPFTNLSSESGAEFLSDGLTEELINALTRVQGLRVVAWDSASQLRGKEDELDTVRRRLHVAYVLRGSIRKTHDRLRISAHLIDTSNNQYVWSEVYDREFQDIVVIETAIASAIVGALRPRFAQRGETVPAEAKRCNLDCYQLCLKGRFHARERTADGLHRSVVCFEQAIAADSNSASAHAGLADTYTLLAEHGFADGPNSLAKAKAVVQRALELDPLSAEAYASYGLIVTLHDWAWSDAETAFRRSLELNAGYAPAHHWYGINFLAVLGRFEQADSELEAAIRLDPLSSIMLEGRGFLRTLMRQYDEAIELFTSMLATDPSFYKAYTAMGRAYMQKGMYAKAIGFLEKGLAIAGEVPNILAALGQAYAFSGDRPTAMNFLEKLQQVAARRSVPPTYFGIIHLGLGEKDAALTCIERAVARHESQVVFLQVHPAYDGLREEPRFQALLDRIGFGSSMSLP